MKKTKIICTIGPSSDSNEVLAELFRNGLDACRLNFSHGNFEEHKKRIEKIKKLREKMNLPIAIILDTKGPEIRLGKFKDNISINLMKNDVFTLTTKEIEGNQNKVSISYKELPKDLKIGNKILIDDGLIELEIIDLNEYEIKCIVMNNGTIASNKGINIPSVYLSLPSLTQKDKEDIIFGIENDIDFIAASFIRNKQDVLNIRKILEYHNNFNIKIISKIESKEGLKNFDEILEVSDGIMVARGDLGVEIPIEEVPIAQKMIIKKCNLLSKTVITATQMLDSMIRNPRPTRAEANDVANAVLDGTSGVMLSGETANGKYPILAIKTMVKIIEVTEKSIDYHELLKQKIEDIATNTTNAIGKSACKIAEDLKAKLIVTATTSGDTTRAISKFKPKSNIVAVTISEKIRRQLSIEWGVRSIIIPMKKNTDELFDIAIKKIRESKLAKSGDMVVLTAGVPVGLSGSTNLIKVQIISKILTKGIGIGNKNVTSRACVINTIQDAIKNFKKGDIIVSVSIDKELMQFVKQSVGIITETAGYTSHGAIVGNSLGIPTIVGARNALKNIKTGDIITIIPSEGIVRISE